MISRKRKYKSRYRRRRSQSFVRKRWFWDIALGFIFLVSLGYLLFFSPAFEMQKISIVTPGGIRPVKIYNLVTGDLGKPLFMVNKGSIREKILEDFSEIKEVSIRKRFFHELFLTIQKRKPVAFFCPNTTTSGCALIDYQGVMFEGVLPASINQIFSTKERIDEKVVAQISEISDVFEGRLEVGVKQFTLSGESRLDVETLEGWQAYFDLSGDLEITLEKLALLLEKELPTGKRKNLEYIDLRFSKVYFRDK